MLAAMDSLLLDTRFLAHLCPALTPTTSSSSSFRVAPSLALCRRRRGASPAPRVILPRRPLGLYPAGSTGPPAVARNGALTADSTLPDKGVYTVGDFMTQKEDLHVVKPTTSVDEALQKLVENRITGFPVVDDDWKLVGVVSDYDLLALDSISGSGQTDTSMFPEVDSTWKTFNEIQRLLSKTNGKVIGELMTPAPLVVRETTNLGDAARLLLETKYRRLPVVNSTGKLVGIITRGNVVRAALEIKRASERSSQSS